MQKEKNFNINSIGQMSVADLAKILEENYPCLLPEKVENVSDLWNAQKLLGKYTADYAFLSAMAARARLIKRQKKKAHDAGAEEALAKEELLNVYAENSKMQYNAVSRMISVYSQITEELRMSGHVT